jgi:two-component system invasion response regulator UvrY
MRILIADDHAVVRRGLKEILVDAFGKLTVGEASNAAETLQLVRKQNWDLVILDISMPGRGGVDVLKEIKEQRPRLPVLILSMHPEDQYAVRAIKAGASGYLTKESASEELIQAIKKIREGRKYISASLAERLAFTLEKDSEKPPHEALSDREHQVLCMIASGKTVTEIAQELSLSVKTISSYRSRILQKMGMKNNAELTTYAIRNHLVE